MDVDAPDRQSGWLAKYGRMTAFLGIVAYCIVRAIPVWGALDGYGVNPWVFLALDLATAYPYVWGLEKMLQGVRGELSTRATYVAGVIVIISVIVPYVYVYIAGYRQMSLFMIVSITIVIAGLIYIGPWRGFQKKRGVR